MKPTRKISRRSFIGRVAGGALVGGAALTAIATRAQAQVTDSDSGPYADPAGRGRGNTGVTDSDPHDPPGRGRGVRRPTTSGITDGDAGRTADPGGNGRGRPNRRCGTRITDGDSGRYVDRAGCGRGRPRR
ncbi:hypothetical protein [Sphingosinicella sp.]|uniref:hypothetical protein n=1 Tax=Sphingosinicella sp. TaxID=1917971 RepID=UPI00403809D4